MDEIHSLHIDVSSPLPNVNQTLSGNLVGFEINVLDLKYVSVHVHNTNTIVPAGRALARAEAFSRRHNHNFGCAQSPLSKLDVTHSTLFFT
jgi:hypothetical protein